MKLYFTSIALAGRRRLCQRFTSGDLRLITMRLCLSAVILFLAFMQVSADSFAQRISLNEKNASLEKVFQSIKGQTGYVFVYNSQDLKSIKIDIRIRDSSVEETMKECLKGLPFTFKIIENNILVKKTAERQQSSAEPLFQQQQIHGRVTDNNAEGIPGVSVQLKGSEAGTATDLDGNYSLNVPNDEGALVFSSIGFTTQEVSINGRDVVNVTMDNDMQRLEEVVVVGYGTVKKRDLTGSVSSVKTEELNAFPVSNVVQAMTGRAPGVYVRQNNGSPGGSISVRIRGTNSISGNNEPLYVVDGFLYSGSPAMLNPADIESMEILKDASATAIYGSRGANGVVLITTKKGKAGKTKVEFEASYSVQIPRNTWDLMDAGEYAAFTNQYLINDGKPAFFTDPTSLGAGTNWQDLVIRSAPMSNSSLSVSGGNEKTQFSVGAGYFDQKGIVTNSDYQRLSLRANVNHELSEYFSFFVTTMYSQLGSTSKNYGAGNRGSNLFGGMLLAPPTLTPYEENGSYRDLKTEYSFISNVIANPLTHIYERNDQHLSDVFLTNAALTVKPFDGFFIKLSGGIDLYNGRSDDYTTTKFIGSPGKASISTSRHQSFLSENIIGYARTIGAHDISAIAGVTYQTYENISVGASGKGYISDAPGTHALGSATDFNTPYSGFSDWTMLSYLGRIQYTLSQKYLATISFRADGSSRYSANNKWGYFPSAGLAWRISEEEFIKHADFISDLKLRIGYGETGSTAISPYYTLNMLSQGKTVLADDIVTWYAPGTRLPSALRWESTAQSNIGLDIGVINNRYRLTVDYYIKNTRDLLNSVQLPASLGYTSTVQNVGKIQNKGLELGLDANIFTGNFRWNIAPNIAFNKNTVVKLYGGSDRIGSTYNTGIVADYINILREGEPVGMFFGYKETGYDETGKITYEDVNDNGLGYEDRRKIGDPNPQFIYSFSSNMAWKGFEFSFFLRGTYGNDIYNLNAISLTQDFNYAHNRPRDMINNTWTPENPNAKYPKASRSNSINMSDRFVEDGSFMRLRNIELAYNFPLQQWNAHWIQRAQIYISGQNLVTWTSYSGYDPEINYSGSSNSINLGLDYFSYPLAKSWAFGIRVEF